MRKSDFKAERSRIPVILYISFVILVFFIHCAPARRPASKIERVIPEKGFDLIPKSEEYFYGFQIASDIEKETKLIEEEFASQYLEELGKRVVSRSSFRNFVEGYEWAFRIIDVSEINAFAALDGKVYVSRGLIEATERESELAGVIGFEMGHIMARSVHQHVSQDSVMQGLVFPGDMIQGQKGLETLNQVLEFEGGAYDYFSKLEYYSEEVEKADKFALYNCHDAGFDPRSFMNFVNRLVEGREPEDFPPWIKRNPWSQKREEHLLSLLKVFPPVLYQEESSRFEDFKIQLESLVPFPFEIEKEPPVPEYAEVLTVNVLGNVAWTDSGLDVFEGQEVYFEATGGISLQKGNPLAYCGPDGYNLKTMQQPISDEKIGALIGKVVKLISIEIDEETGEEIRNEIERSFFIGADNRVRMEIDGRLFLGINENIVGDNSGEFKVTIYLEESIEE